MAVLMFFKEYKMRIEYGNILRCGSCYECYPFNKSKSNLGKEGKPWLNDNNPNMDIEDSYSFLICTIR